MPEQRLSPDRATSSAAGAILVTLAAALSAAAASPGSDAVADTVVAHPVATAITLDGRLDEPPWRVAGQIADLTQQDPHPGEPSPYATEVLVLADSDTLFIGVICHDPDPRRIAVHTMERDGDLWGDDTIAWVLDTFADRRTGYFFRLNAAGARQDGLVSGPEEISTDWDGIWDARVARSPDGWTAEIAIPASSLRFDPALASWGFNLERTVARNRTVLRWQGVTLDASLYDLRRAGQLGGVEVLRQGIGLSVAPYGLAAVGRDGAGEPYRSDADGGLDATYNLTPELTGVLTLRTDFAETEVDTRQVNLTRFPLFFPEKRAFFLEGASLFSFGAGLGRDFIPFFSRRIGLYEEEQVPIRGGVKLLGRAGRWSLGVLDVATGTSELTESTNLFAGRVTRDVGEHLRLGVIATDGDPDGIGDNALVGVDALWQSSTFRGDKNLSVGAWAASSSGDVPEGQRTGWGFKVDYPNDLWDLYLVVKELGDGLDPALGFLPRPGTRWYQAGGAFQPRPADGALSWVRQLFFELNAHYVEDLAGRAESWRLFTAPFNAQTESGEHLEANVVPQYERLDEGFEIVEGIVIPPGEYRFTRYRVEAQSSRHRPWRVGTTIWFGAFYDGRLTELSSSVTYTTPAGHLQLRLEGEHNVGRLPGGDFVQRLWQTKVGYAFTPDLILSAYAQYDSDSRNLGLNTRLRWTIRPGNDLFVVWDRGWEHPAGGVDWLALHPSDDRLAAKLRWTFRW